MDPCDADLSHLVDDSVGLQQREHHQLTAYARDLSRTYRQLREAQTTLADMYLSTLAALAATIEAREPYLEGHSQAVAAYALPLGQRMQLPEERMKALLRAALLHDIGKIGVPDVVLKKAGPLDQTEWEQMRRHPELGYQILSGLSFLGEALLGIRHHHERYDGRGYPSGLAGQDIPPIARILAVCDALDAMTSERVYRTAMSLDQAVDQLLSERGRQFAPRESTLLVETLQNGSDPRSGVARFSLKPTALRSE